MLEAAKADFGKVLNSAKVHCKLSQRTIELLLSGDDYA